MTSVVDIITEYEGKILQEVQRLDTLYDAYHGDVAPPYAPPTAGDEYFSLRKRSKLNMLPLVVKSASQALHIEDYQSKTKANSKRGMEILKRNGWDARQGQLFDSIGLFGYAYVSALPGDDVPFTGMYSPRRMFALYDDPSTDTYPEYAFEIDRKHRITAVWDDNAIHRVKKHKDPNTLQSYYTIDRSEEHRMGLCPVRKVVLTEDLEGRAMGEVEPLLTLQTRLNQLVFDLMIAVSYNSYKVRGISGLVPELDEDGNPVPIELSAKRLFMLESPDSKPWQLDGTDLKGYLDAVDDCIKEIAATSQTPVHVLQGSLANINADGLANAESAFQRKVDRYQHTIGEAIEDVIALALAADGGKADPEAEVKWRDAEQRTLSNVADALVKLAAGLEIPAEGLWHRLPGVTQGELDQWKKLRESDPMYQYAQMANEQKLQMPDSRVEAKVNEPGSRGNQSPGGAGSASPAGGVRR